jgi:hypothetical protein
MECCSWKPWFEYSRGCNLVCGSGSDSFAYSRWEAFFADNRGYRFACDECIKRGLRDNGLWAIGTMQGRL